MRICQLALLLRAAALFCTILGLLALTAPFTHGGTLDDLLKEVQPTRSGTAAGPRPQGQNTTVSGLKEALSIQKLYDQFKPVVTSSMSKVGVAKAYKDMMAPYQSLPFASKDSMDLDHYVTNKALDGLFTMVAEEEKKIRTDPAARVTDLLKKVFAK